MAVLGKATKGFVGVKAAKGVAKNPKILKAGAKAAPPAAKFGWKLTKPRLTRRTRRRAERLGEAVGSALAVYGPQAAEQFGLIEPPKPKRTAPRVAAGVVIGATAVYLLEPEHGREHREQLRQLVG